MRISEIKQAIIEYNKAIANKGLGGTMPDILLGAFIEKYSGEQDVELEGDQLIQFKCIVCFAGNLNSSTFNKNLITLLKDFQTKLALSEFDINSFCAFYEIPQILRTTANYKTYSTHQDGIILARHYQDNTPSFNNTQEIFDRWFDTSVSSSTKFKWQPAFKASINQHTKELFLDLSKKDDTYLDAIIDFNKLSQSGLKTESNFKSFITLNNDTQKSLVKLFNKLGSELQSQTTLNNCLAFPDKVTELYNISRNMDHEAKNNTGTWNLLWKQNKETLKSIRDHGYTGRTIDSEYIVKACSSANKATPAEAKSNQEMKHSAPVDETKDNNYIQNMNNQKTDAEKLKDIITDCQTHYSNSGLFKRSNFKKLVAAGKISTVKDIQKYVLKNPKSRTASMYLANHITGLPDGEYKSFLKKYMENYKFGTFKRSKLVNKLLSNEISDIEGVKIYAENNKKSRTARLLKN